MKNLLMLFSAIALSFTLATAEGKCGDSNETMKCQAGKCGDSKETMKCQAGKCGSGQKEMPPKGKCGS